MKSALTLKSILVAGGIAALAAGANAGTAVKQMPEIEPVVEPWWGADLTFGMESKYMFRGYDQYLGNSPLIYTQLNMYLYKIKDSTVTASVWYGDNLSAAPNGFNEVDFYLDYTYNWGPVAISGGYNAYLFPGVADGGTQDLNEVYLGLAYTALPYVTPSFKAYQGFGDTAYQGEYFEFKVQGTIPVYKEIVTLLPYAMISYANYMAVGQSSVSNYQLGLRATFALSEHITLSGDVNYSGPLNTVSHTAATGPQPNTTVPLYGVAGGYNPNSDIWAGCAITFAF